MQNNKLYLLLFVCVVITTTCKKGDKVQAQTQTTFQTPYYRAVALSEIPENPNYLQLPFEGTKWKFVGYVDEDTQQIQLMTGCSDNSTPFCFTAAFLQGEISVRTGNKLVYEYEIINSTKNLKIKFVVGTKAGEDLDGQDFRRYFGHCFEYLMSPKGLCLYYTLMLRKYSLFAFAKSVFPSSIQIPR